MISIASDNRRPRNILPIAAVSLLMIKKTMRCFYLCHTAISSFSRALNFDELHCREGIKNVFVLNIL